MDNISLFLLVGFGDHPTVIVVRTVVASPPSLGVRAPNGRVQGIDVVASKPTDAIARDYTPISVMNLVLYRPTRGHRMRAPRPLTRHERSGYRDTEVTDVE